MCYWQIRLVSWPTFQCLPAFSEFPRSVPTLRWDACARCRFSISKEKIRLGIHSVPELDLIVFDRVRALLDS